VVKSFPEVFYMKIIESGWSINFDVNRDGVLAIGDLLEALRRMLFAPGDNLVIAPILNWLPSLAESMQMTSDSYGNFYSGIVSIAFWIVIALAFRDMLAKRV
jgi:hypothetical protein